MGGNIKKNKWSNWTLIGNFLVVLLCIVLLISGIALLGAIFFNWGQEIDKGQHTNDVISVRAGITYSRTYEGEFNTLTFVVMGREVEWDRYDVRADGMSLPHSDDIDWAGDIEEFTWDVEGENIGEELEVMVIDIEADKVIWQSSLVVTAGQIEDVVDTINIRAWITYNASSEGSENALTFEVLSGTVDWSRYEVLVDGIPLDRSTEVDLAGDTESFSWAQNESNVGQRIDARIRNIEKDTVIWMSEIIVRSA